MQHFRLRVLSGVLPFLLAAPPFALAQPQPPTQAEANAALNPGATFTQAQLDQMLAPIALYPDQLLTQLLMAATFPDQVIAAGQWLQDGKNAGLKGNDLVAALQPLPWDPSVKSLVAFPQIIAMMNDHFDWTEALGGAFASQQVQLMARVQFLRGRAVAAGQLKSTPQLAINRQGEEVLIEPVDPATIYVPVYNPALVYGDWPDADDPPVYIPPPPGFYNGDVGPGIAFSVAFGVAAPLWGWGHFDWRQHEVVVDPKRYEHLTTPGATTGNHVAIQNQVWKRTAPIVPVPAAQVPKPPENIGKNPPGTVTTIKPPSPPPANAPAPPAPGAHAPPPPPTNTPTQHPPEPPGAHAPAPPGKTPTTPEEHAPPPGAHTPPGEHAPPPTEHAPPEPGKTPTKTPEEHTPPPGAHTPPPAEHAPPEPGKTPTKTPEEHTPPPGAHTPPPAEHALPPTEHAPPPAEHAPPPANAPVHPPAPPEHAPPPPEHAPPPPAAHAPPAPPPPPHPATPPPAAKTPPPATAPAKKPPEGANTPEPQH